MSKSLKWLMAVLMTLSLVAAACGSDDDGDSASSDGTTDEAAADEAAADEAAADEAAGDEATDGSGEGSDVRVALVLPGEINDLSWNQQMYEGALALESEGLISEVAFTELVPEGDSERAIRGYAEDGYDLVVAHSFGYGETAKAVGADFPDTAFAWGGGIDAAEGNVADYEQPFHEAYYLLGIIAGDLSETGVLGGAGGFDIPACHSLIEAFYLGAQEINPDARGVTTYTGDWVDVAIAKEAASAAADEGADVFGACGEGPVLGQIELAAEQGLYSTGYVGDMSSIAPESVVASMVWDTAEVLRPMIEDINAGSFLPAKFYSIGVAEDGLVIAINPDLEGDISPEALALVEERRAGIVDGSFEVPFIPE